MNGDGNAQLVDGHTPDILAAVTKVDFPSTGSAWCSNGICLDDRFRDDFAARFTGELEVLGNEAGDWTLSTTSDDGTWVFVDGKQVVDNGGLHGMKTVTSAPISLTAGKHSLKVLFFERGGGAGVQLRCTRPGSSGPTIIPASRLSHVGGVELSKTVVPAMAGINAGDLAAGLAADFFDFRVTGNGDKHIVDGKTPDVSGVVTKVDFGSTGAAWNANGMNLDNRFKDDFAARFKGIIHIAETADYVFFTESDDGTWLVVNGDLVVNNGGLHGMRTIGSGTLHLVEGYHSIELVFFERGGGAGVKLFYHKAGTNRKTIVPASVLFHTPIQNTPAATTTTNAAAAASTTAAEAFAAVVAAATPAAAPTTQPSVDVAAACTSGTVKTSGGVTFCYGSKGKTFAAANTFCQSQGLALVEPRSAALDAAVTAVCDYDCTWLGLTCATQDTTCDTGFTGWAWASSGASLTAGTSHFTMGNDNTINGGGTNEYCGHFWTTTPSWGPQTCSSTYYGALCVAPSVNTNQ